MFIIAPHELFLCFLLFWLVLLAILWARELYRQRKNDWEMTQNRPCTCEECQLTFLMKNNQSIARCPRCNAVCILRRHH